MDVKSDNQGKEQYAGGEGRGEELSKEDQQKLIEVSLLGAGGEKPCPCRDSLHQPLLRVFQELLR